MEDADVTASAAMKSATTSGVAGSGARALSRHHLSKIVKSER